MAGNQDLAKALAGKPLSPEGEQGFLRDLYFAPGWRDWRRDFMNTMGGPPNVGPGGDYNYRLAWTAGASPQLDPASGTFHGLSEAEVPPFKPIPLKASDHPTRWKAEFMNKFAANPDLLPAEQWTSEMRNELRKQAERDLLVKLLLNGAPRPTVPIED